MATAPNPRFYEGPGFDSEDNSGLADAYENTTGLVAYLDESYRSPAQSRDGQTYYLLTAVLVERQKMAAIRGKLLEIADTETWHTTDEARTEEGQAKLLQMTHFLARRASSVIALHGQIDRKDRNAEGTRAACFDTLLRELCARQLLEKTGLAVYDRRLDPAQRAVDQRTISGLRKSGAIHRNLQVREGRPARETLLWAPDAVAWATRQALTGGVKRFLQPLISAHRVDIVSVP